MTDHFVNYTPELDSPASDGFDITPNDGTNLPTAARAIYVGVGGDVELITIWGTTLTFKNVISGDRLPVRTARVKAGKTTATNLIGLV